MTPIQAHSVGSMKALLLLLLPIAVVYGNSLKADWHFDDFPRIVENQNIHLDELSARAIKPSLYWTSFKDGRTKLHVYRPVANFSLALNWYLGKDEIRGYHVVNIAIHLLTAFFLYLTIRRIFRTPNLKEDFPEAKGSFVALLAAVLWAVNPIHTQAVTYIIQRMAILAALFSIIGIFLYIQARLSSTFIRKGLCFSGSGVAFLLAVCSKENAAVWPLSLLLVEVAFFRDMGSAKTRRAVYLTTLLASATVLLIGFFLMGEKGFQVIMDGYENRPFTPWERLMTQGRVLIFYLSLIFYPVPTRLSFEHDVSISHSLFQPWQTLPAWLLVLCLVSVGIVWLKKRPLLGFCILFFFVNQAMESGIIGLEMLFEHRNYLPSFFLFVPVAVGIFSLLTYYRANNRWVFALICGFVVLLITGLGFGTHVRNAVWATEETLWADAVEKAPMLQRPLQHLGDAYSRQGRFDQAAALLEKAMNGKNANRKDYQGVVLISMADLAYREGRYDRGAALAKRALLWAPENDFARYTLIFNLIKGRRLDEALHIADILVRKDTFSYMHQYLKGLVLLHLDDNERATVHLKNALFLFPDFQKALLPAAVAYGRIGRTGQGERLINKALPHTETPILAGLALIENRLMAGDSAGADLLAERLLSVFSITDIVSRIDDAARGEALLPLSWNRLSERLAAALADQAEEIQALMPSSESGDHRAKASVEFASKKGAK